MLAWPTVLLFAGAVAAWLGSTAAALADVWPWPVSTVVNAVSAYLLFTVAHDASHHSASSHAPLNRWLGRIATPFFAPEASFSVFRFIHMQHHRFTNHDDGRDPDDYTHRGPRWQLPLRWLTIDLYYVVFYARHAARRPRREKVELAAQILLVAAIAVVAVVTGHGFDLLVLYVVPSRLAILYLGWAFDYLPHNGLHHTPAEDK